MPSAILTYVLGIPAALDYVLLFTLTFLETAVLLGVILPGETAVIMGGVLSARGVLRPELVFAAAAIGCVTGDTTGYLLGARLGPRLFARDRFFGLLKRSSVEEARTIFSVHAGKAVLLGRFTALLRAFAPAVAGASGVPMGRFLVFNILGGVAWAGTSTLLGYLAGNAWQVAAARFGHATIALGAVVLLTLAWLRLRRRLKYRVRLAIGLTAAAIFMVLGFYSFVEIAEAWIRVGGLTTLDRSAASLATSIRSSWAGPVLTVASLLGGVVATSLLAAVTTAWLALHAERRRAKVFASTVLVGALAILGVKEFFHAAASTTRIALEHGWAFPSATAFMSVLVYGLSSAVAWRVLGPSRPGPRIALVGAAVAIVLSSASGHVYNGARWTTDILAGGLLGGAWLAMGIGLLAIRDHGNEEPDAGASSSP